LHFKSLGMTQGFLNIDLKDAREVILQQTVCFQDPSVSLSSFLLNTFMSPRLFCSFP
jgi:hypothetical protein